MTGFPHWPIRPLRAALTGFVIAAGLCLCGAAEANGRSDSGPSIYAPSWQDGALAIVGRAASGAAGAVWRTGAALTRSGSDLVAEAARYVGSGKFTELPGAWCADAVSFWLKATGRPPLANRMAASALAYGPHVAEPREGDLVVTAHHVGVVARLYGDGSIDEISGNWRRRVAEAHVARMRGMRFVRP